MGGLAGEHIVLPVGAHEDLLATVNYVILCRLGNQTPHVRAACRVQSMVSSIWGREGGGPGQYSKVGLPYFLLEHSKTCCS